MESSLPHWFSLVMAGSQSVLCPLKSPTIMYFLPSWCISLSRWFISMEDVGLYTLSIRTLSWAMLISIAWASRVLFGIVTNFTLCTWIFVFVAMRSPPPPLAVLSFLRIL